MTELIVVNTHSNNSKVMCVKNDFNYEGIAMSIISGEYERHKQDIDYLNCVEALEIIVNYGYKIDNEEYFHKLLDKALKHLYNK